MRAAKVITNRAPEFLKAAYKSPMVKLVDHVGQIPPGESFIQWAPGCWTVYTMRGDIPCRVISFASLNSAIYRALK